MTETETSGTAATQEHAGGWIRWHEMRLKHFRGEPEAQDLASPNETQESEQRRAKKRWGELTTCKEACAYLAIGVKGLRRLVQEGRLRCFTRGRLRRFRMADLQALKGSMQLGQADVAGDATRPEGSST